MHELTTVYGNTLGAPDPSEGTIRPHLYRPDYVVFTAFDDNAISLDGWARYGVCDGQLVRVGWAKKGHKLAQRPQSLSLGGVGCFGYPISGHFCERRSSAAWWW